MPVPLARPVSLTPEEHARLDSLVRAHSTPQALALRCRLILRIAAPDRPSNLHVATELACERQTVGRWRSRYLAHGFNGLQDAPRAGRPQRVSPSERVEVLAMATTKPATYHGPATRGSLDDVVAALPQPRRQPRSRSRLWRLLEEAALKPHRSVSGLNSHDPDFAAKAQALCQRSRQALRFYQEGRLVICADEKTGMPSLQRGFPTQPVQPGKPEKREYESIRQGVRALLASFVVPTGRLVWHLGHTRTRADWAAHLAHVVRPLPAMQRDDWVVDNLNTHWSLEVCQRVAHWWAVPLSPKA